MSIPCRKDSHSGRSTQGPSVMTQQPQGERSIVQKAFDTPPIRTSNVSLNPMGKASRGTRLTYANLLPYSRHELGKFVTTHRTKQRKSLGHCCAQLSMTALRSALHCSEIFLAGASVVPENPTKHTMRALSSNTLLTLISFLLDFVPLGLRLGAGAQLVCSAAQKPPDA